MQGSVIRSSYVQGTIVKDEGIDRAIRNTLAERDVRERGPCPDDSRIAAYLDSQLRPEENAEFEAHAARCPACREILALSMRLGEETGVAEAAPTRKSTRVLFHFAVPVSAVALLIVAAGLGILYYRSVRSAGRAPAETQTADLRKPAETHEPALLSRAPESKESESPASPQPPKAKKLSPVSTGGYPSEKIKPPVPQARKDEVAAGAYDAVRQERENGDFAVTLQAARAGMKAETPQAGGVRVPGEAAIPPPSLPRSRFRAPQATAPGSPPGKASEAQTQNAASVETTAAGSGGDPSRKPGTEGSGSSATKRVGDRTFVWTQDIWVDSECQKHPEASVVVISPDSEEYTEILKSYPELRDLRPVKIFWKGRELFLR